MLTWLRSTSRFTTDFVNDIDKFPSRSKDITEFQVNRLSVTILWQRPMYFRVAGSSRMSDTPWRFFFFSLLVSIRQKTFCRKCRRSDRRSDERPDLPRYIWSWLKGPVYILVKAIPLIAHAHTHTLIAERNFSKTAGEGAVGAGGQLNSRHPRTGLETLLR